MRLESLSGEPQLLRLEDVDWAASEAASEALRRRAAQTRADHDAGAPAPDAEAPEAPQRLPSPRRPGGFSRATPLAQGAAEEREPDAAAEPQSRLSPAEATERWRPVFESLRREHTQARERRKELVHQSEQLEAIHEEVLRTWGPQHADAALVREYLARTGNEIQELDARMQALEREWESSKAKARRAGALPGIWQPGLR